LRSVSLTGATGAELNLDVANYSPGSQLSYRLNGGAWRTIGYPFPDTNGAWRAVSAPVALSDLRGGDNSLELAAAQAVQVTNIDLTVDNSGGTPPPPPPPPPTNTPTPLPPTSTPIPQQPTNTPAPANTATPTTVPTRTAVPTNTPAPANTATPTRTPVPPTATPTNPPSQTGSGHPNFTTSAHVSPGQALPGTSVTITASVTSDSNAQALVDIEVYDSSGAKVYQRAYDNQQFSSGQARNYSDSFRIPSTTRPGGYTVKLGMFSPGWGTLYNWNNDAANYSVV